jgi:hypothetical protein
LFEVIRKYKREFVYSSYLFLVFELLVSKDIVTNITMYKYVTAVGFLLVASWVVGTFVKYSKKKVSKHSDAVLKIALRSRLYTQVLMPIFFYSALVFFFLYNHTVYLNQIIIVVSVVLFFNLFLNVRTSYSKVYSVERLTRLVYDFMGIVMFYIISIVLYRLGQPLWINILAIFAISFGIFMFTLITHKKESIRSAIVAGLSSLILAILVYTIRDLNFFIQPSVLGIAFYTVISIWNVRFSGQTKLVEYIPPVMYSLMGIILILSV